jgi:lipopolysaccharide export system permease protein
MWILTRYLLRAHLGPFLFSFGALTGVVLINTLAKRLAELAGKGLPLDVILKFFVLALPATVALTFPMAVLVAVLYTFSNFSAENEITALKASGVDLRRLLIPLLVVAAGITAGMVWFNDRVLPEANHRWSQLYLNIARTTPTLALQAQTLNRIAPTGGTGQTFYLRAARVEPGTNRLWDVSIFDVSNSAVVRTIYADSGRARFNQAQTDLVLQLYDGHMREVQLINPKAFRRIDFRQQRLGIPGVGTALSSGGPSGSYRSDREMTIGMLQAQIDTLRRDQAAQRVRARELAMADLDAALGIVRRDSAGQAQAGFLVEGLTARERSRRTADDMAMTESRSRTVEGNIRDFAVEIHKKYSIAVATLVFVIVGAPLALRFGGGGIGMVIASSMVIFSIYYIGLIGGESLAGRGYLTPIVAMWMVNVLMTVLGCLGLATMGRETATSRSNAWDAMLQLFSDFAAQLMRRRRATA